MKKTQKMAYIGIREDGTFYFHHDEKNWEEIQKQSIENQKAITIARLATWDVEGNEFYQNKKEKR